EWPAGAIAPLLKSETVRLRYLRPGDAGYRPANTEILQVLNGQDYYVNDGSTADDVYTTTIGQTYNGTSVTGLTPSSPVDSVQAILSHYPVSAGDVIHVDTGNYAIATDIAFQAANTGTSERPVT